MPHHAPPGPHPFVEVFDIPLRFDQATNSLSFPASQLCKPIVRSYAELQAIIDYFPFDRSPGGDGRTAVSVQLRLLLLDSLQQLGRKPELGTASQLLHMSAATLRRRLADERTSYREVRVNCQREIAETLLRRSTVPVEDIARRVGLSDDRAFRRAFREWTGETPTDFRKKWRVDP
jgi:AraC-like DNA-binding protein